MAKQNKTRYALLGMLSSNSMSGYDIKKSINHSIGYFWNENYGHIYTILKRLYTEGCVDKNTEKNKGKPDRIVYSITAKGKDELMEWLKIPADDMKLRNELLLKIFFSKDMPVEEVIDKIKLEHEKNNKLLCEYNEVEKMILKCNNDSYERELWLTTLNFGKSYAEMILEWCNCSIDSLNKLKDKKFTEEVNK